MTQEEIKTLKLYAALTGTMGDYVVLKEDEQGRYIEYAFIEGAPHDNRCLSRYNKPHPKFYAETPNYAPRHLNEVGEIYKLMERSCGNQYRPIDDERHCSAGHPCKGCMLGSIGKYWTYDEPLECACWGLGKVNIDEINDSPTIRAYRQTLDNVCEWLRTSGKGQLIGSLKRFLEEK